MGERSVRMRQESSREKTGDVRGGWDSTAVALTFPVND